MSMWLYNHVITDLLIKRNIFVLNAFYPLIAHETKAFFTILNNFFFFLSWVVTESPTQTCWLYCQCRKFSWVKSINVSDKLSTTWSEIVKQALSIHIFDYSNNKYFYLNQKYLTFDFWKGIKSNQKEISCYNHAKCPNSWIRL